MTRGLQVFCWRWQRNSRGLYLEVPQVIRALLRPAGSQHPDPVFAATRKGSPSCELVSLCMECCRNGLQPRAPPLWHRWRMAGSRYVVAWGWRDMGKEASTGCFEAGIAELGWDPAARLALSPPTAESPQPWRSCYHPSPPITCRNSPPFGSPADVSWLRLRKITTPLLDMPDTSSSGTKSEEGICSVLIKSNFPCTHSHVNCRARNCPASLTHASCAATVPRGP